jgi:glycerophosphoryl diester phosphodiesterase
MAWEGFRRIGHRDASALAPANTLASFDAAVAAGIDIVEFDVRERRGELVLAHTIFHAARDGNVLLGDALAHLAGERFAGFVLSVDVKHPGFEARLLDDLRCAGLLERTLLSSQMMAVIDRLRMLDPHARTGISSVGKSTEQPGVLRAAARHRAPSQVGLTISMSGMSMRSVPRMLTITLTTSSLDGQRATAAGAFM